MDKDGEVEWLDLVDEADRVIGRATRQDCHQDRSLMHRVVHILVFNRSGALLLQLRGPDKEIQPGKWDTSVGGHIAAGEGYGEALARELEEELGVRPACEAVHMYDYIWRSPVETERVRTFRLLHDGPFSFQEEEIEEIRFWLPEEIETHLGRTVFTPNFEEEWARYKVWKEGAGIA